MAITQQDGNFIVQQDGVSRIRLNAAENISATGTATWGSLATTATATVSHPATVAGAWGSLAASTTAAVSHAATATSAWGSLTGSATATVTSDQTPEPDPPARGGGYSEPRRRPNLKPAGITVHATASSNWAGLTATAEATVAHQTTATARWLIERTTAAADVTTLAYRASDADFESLFVLSLI